MEANQPGGAVLSPDGQRRAVVSKRVDNTFLVVFERKVVGDGIYEPKFYWSREAKGPSITDSRRRAIDLAKSEFGMAREDADEEG